MDEFYGGSPLHWGGKLGRKARWAVRGGQKAVVGERRSKFCFDSGATNMSYTTKKSLLARVRSGDEISWREFYETCRPLVFLVGDCGLTCDENEELVQLVAASRVLTRCQRKWSRSRKRMSGNNTRQMRELQKSLWPLFVLSGHFASSASAFAKLRRDMSRRSGLRLVALEADCLRKS